MCPRFMVHHDIMVICCNIFGRGSGRTTMPSLPAEFLFEFTLKGVSQIHGGHPGTTVQEKQNRERRVVLVSSTVQEGL